MSDNNKKYNIAVIPGDGIGPEVMDAGLHVLTRIAEKFGCDFKTTKVLAGGAAIDATGKCLPQETVDICKASDAVLLAAVGGPKWNDLPGDERPEKALLELRKLRFFFSPLCLQPKMAFSYRVPVTQQLLHEKLSALSLSMQDARQLEALAILRELQDMVSHSMSDEVCSFVMTQLTVQMYSLSSSFGVDPAPTPLLGAQRPATVEAMFTICREQMTALFSSIRNLRTTSNSAIDEVCRFVAQNLAEPLTLTVAAEYVHMNPAYLSRVFKKETGQAFNAYVSEQRIRRAKQLLQTKDRIIDIAGNVGFENSKYFSQVFKKRTGMTPQEYRAAMQKEAEL